VSIPLGSAPDPSGFRQDRPAAPRAGVHFLVPSSSDRGETSMLDVVFITGILALVALVAVVGKGVERL
jgi:hypothetical protein